MPSLIKIATTRVWFPAWLFLLIPPGRRRSGWAIVLFTFRLWQLKRLIPFLPEFLESLEAFGHIDLADDVRFKLLSISPATADRILKAERAKLGKSKGLTKPGHLIKKQIEVRTFADWKELRPGFFEADLVAHGGTRADGQFLQTLTLTDIETGWTELGALLRRSEADVINALDEMRDLIPFPLLGIDTDNGIIHKLRVD